LDRQISERHAALANLNVKTAYLDGELCGVDEAGLPTFAHTQAATDGERNVQLVYYAFDLLHLDGWTSRGFSSSSARRFWSHCSSTSLAFSSMAMRSAMANSY
jgi:ATP-dependent DNA ligase